MRNILVVAAHPDDEILGCGGTIAKHVSLGDKVHVAILAEGLTSRFDNRDEVETKDLQDLRHTAKKANDILGSSSLTFFDFPDNRMDSVDRLEVTKKIELLIEQYEPSVVYSHHSGDVNIDHRIAHEAVITACRPQPGSFVRTMLFFETASSTEWQPSSSNISFNPNWFNNISETLTLKLKALECYNSEMRLWPHSRSIQALKYLSRWRGASIGVTAAEAFVLGRHVEN